MSRSARAPELCGSSDWTGNVCLDILEHSHGIKHDRSSVHVCPISVGTLDESELPKSRTKPDVEIDHTLNVESLWRKSTLKSLIQGYSVQMITQCNAG